MVENQKEKASNVLEQIMNLSTPWANLMSFAAMIYSWVDTSRTTPQQNQVDKCVNHTFMVRAWSMLSLVGCPC